MVRKSSKREALVQTGLRLEAEILEKLRSSRQGFSEEIRSRLQRTFAEDATDPVTRELRDGLVNIANLVRQDFGVEWHIIPQAYQAFVAAMMQRIAAYAPPIGIIRGSAATKVMLLLGENDSPETIGRLRERDDQRAHVYRHLITAQKRKNRGFTELNPPKNENDHE